MVRLPLLKLRSGHVPVTDLVSVVDADRLVVAFGERTDGHTRQAYARDLEDFARAIEARSIEQAAVALVGFSAGHANALALHYRATLIERQLSAATINRRLAALRSLVKLARTLGVITWTLEVAGVRGVRADRRGPSRENIGAMLRELRGREGPKAARDLAIVRLAFDLRMRRFQIVALSLEDFEIQGGHPIALRIVEKGARGTVRVRLTEAAIAALVAWNAWRASLGLCIVYQDGHCDCGAPPHALFVAVDRNHRGHRLTGRAVHQIIGRLGLDVGAGVVRPHGLGHSAITAALDLTSDVRRVRKFSRHADVRTVMAYDDDREDGLEIAELVSRSVVDEPS